MHLRKMKRGRSRHVGVVTLDFRGPHGAMSTLRDVPVGREVEMWRRRLARSGAQLVAAREYRVVAS